MRNLSKPLILASLVLAASSVASAQTADDVVEKYLAAIGGRAALGKVTSRSTTGTITLTTPAGEISGPIEVLNQTPNKARTLIKLDLSAFGAGPMTVDQRFDGKTGYVIDTLQGNRDITGNQLDNMRNSSFPNPLLTYKESGATIKLSGNEKVGDKDAIVLIVEPASGSVVRQYFDASSFLLVKAVMKVDVPQMGGDVEQTTEFSDYRDVDGVKIPFSLKSSSSVQSFVVAVSKVEHNVPVDEKLFSKPPAP
jgi:hypothetical protein